MNRRLYLAERAYRLLLLAYPHDYRRANDELVQVFRDEYRDVRARGIWAVTRFWLYTIYDTGASAFALRRDGQRNTSSSHSTRPSMLDDFLQDVRFGARSLRRSIGFTIVAVTILGLGIGANTTVFTIVNALFLDAPPHVSDPDALVRMNRTRDGRGTFALQYPDYVHYRDNNEVFEALAAYDPDGPAVTVGAGGANVAARAWFVSHNYFDALGVRPAAGRWFLPEEDRTPGTRRVAVISEGFWQRSLGGDPSAVGSEVTLNGHTFTIVGVAPAGFYGVSPIESPPDVWVPIMTQPVLTATTEPFALERVPDNIWYWLWSVGRLKPGVSVEAAQANIDGLASYVAENFAEWNEGLGITLTQDYRFHPPSGSALLSMTRMLTVVVVLVLLIASANIAILMLARASSRRRDVGVRIAMGASRGRVIRQLFTESALLAAMGGASGLGLAFWSAELAAGLMPLSFAVDFTPDLPVLLFSIGLTFATALVFGVLPARQAASVDVNEVLKGDARTGTRSWTRNGLVVAQVALSLLLVTGAGLFARSLGNARGVSLGFELDSRLILGMNLRNHGYTEEQGRQFIRDGLERLRSHPGVVRATTTTMVPFQGTWETGIQPEGWTGGDDEYFYVGANAVSAAYFETMGIPIVAGRGFNDRDVVRAPFTVIVNERFVREVWAEADPIGKQIRSGSGSTSQNAGIAHGDRDDYSATVIGVVRDATYYEIGEETPPHLFFSVGQVYQSGVRFLVETRADPMTIAGQLQAELHALDPAIAISSVTSLREIFENEIGRFRTSATMVGLFALLALILATVGLYGVLSYLVVQRTRDIGIQVALGATRARVAAAVVIGGLRLTLAGVVIGVIGAFAASRLATSFLYGIKPTDPATFAVVPLLLTAVAGLASLIPARRAASVDPVEALRRE